MEWQEKLDPMMVDIFSRELPPAQRNAFVESVGKGYAHIQRYKSKMYNVFKDFCENLNVPKIFIFGKGKIVDLSADFELTSYKISTDKLTTINQILSSKLKQKKGRSREMAYSQQVFVNNLPIEIAFEIVDLLVS